MLPATTTPRMASRHNHRWALSSLVQTAAGSGRPPAAGSGRPRGRLRSVWRRRGDRERRRVGRGRSETGGAGNRRRRRGDSDWPRRREFVSRRPRARAPAAAGSAMRGRSVGVRCGSQQRSANSKVSWVANGYGESCYNVMLLLKQGTLKQSATVCQRDRLYLGNAAQQKN